ncbi:bacillithiol biosynthesis cysteine-adding enzyme BshC [Paenibacillus sp. HJGM_3]|uniref:bacillithiol biosynthesis cysteine-adding enzyme BshC n=1 Tax=Paenibacillus sp. HJGM_3 TaxID=3379816 RepID=UPI00385C08FE
MRIEPYIGQPGQPLARDHKERFASVAQLYAYDPQDPQTIQRRADWLDTAGRPQADRSALADTLRRYNETIGNAPEALEAIEALRDPRTLAVVGGQQAGLFTGPLLVMYKAITALQAARAASERLNRRVVPVFWIAGEDHDWDEVNHTHVLTDALSIHKIKLATVPEKRGPVSDVLVSREDWLAAIDELEGMLMNTEFKGPLLNQVRQACMESDTLSLGFARLLAQWFGAYGLILVDSADPALRQLEAPMFRRLVEGERELSACLMATQTLMQELGYKPQAEVRPDNANLFVLQDGERLLLSCEDGLYTDKRGELRLTRDQLLQLAEAEPERLSNNVMTRPLMQDYLLPVLSAVLGTSEIAYWGLLRPAFEQFGLQMPILTQRLEFTLVEGTLQKQMNKYDLQFEDVLLRYEEKKQAWLAGLGSTELAERFADAKLRFTDMYKPIVDTIGALNPGMRKLGETNLQKIVEQIEFLETRANEAFASQFDTALRHWERLYVSLAPQGKPQERVYNALMYLVKYGDGWLKELIDMPLSPDDTHRIVYF